MFTTLSTGVVSIGVLLTKTRTPGVIVGPIAKILGGVYNLLFDFIYNFIQSGSLAVAIVLFTLLVKLILTPLQYTQQRSSYKMQKLQPQINKIKAKYEGKKDNVSQQKMSMEVQEFQKKNGISLFGGCLPLLVQLPILYALFYIFQQPYMYVDVISEAYGNIANYVLTIPDQAKMDIFKEAVLLRTTETVDLKVFDDLIKVINVLNPGDWSEIYAKAGEYANELIVLVGNKTNIESFMGLNLTFKPGLTFPGIFIPLLSGASSWLQTWLMSKRQSLDPSDPTAATMKSMNMVMPIMMGFITINMPAALGIYWTVSNLFTILQSYLLNKYLDYKDKKISEEAA